MQSASCINRQFFGVYDVIIKKRKEKRKGKKKKKKEEKGGKEEEKKREEEGLGAAKVSSGRSNRI
jgi:hypothetical protein